MQIVHDRLKATMSDMLDPPFGRKCILCGIPFPPFSFPLSAPNGINWAACQPCVL